MCHRLKYPCRYLAEVPVDKKLGEPRPSSITMHVQWVPWDIGKQSGMAALPLLFLHAVGFLIDHRQHLLLLHHLPHWAQAAATVVSCTAVSCLVSSKNTEHECSTALLLPCR